MTKLFSCESNHQPKLARSWLSFNAPFYGAGRELPGLRGRRATPNPPLPLPGGERTKLPSGEVAWSLSIFACCPKCARLPAAIRLVSIQSAFSSVQFCYLSITNHGMSKLSDGALVDLDIRKTDESI